MNKYVWIGSVLAVSGVAMSTLGSAFFGMLFMPTVILSQIMIIGGALLVLINIRLRDRDHDGP